jgi:hypothetical protein
LYPILISRVIRVTFLEIGSEYSCRHELKWSSLRTHGGMT